MRKFKRNITVLLLMGWLAAFSLPGQYPLFADSCPLCLCNPDQCSQKKEEDKSCVFPDRRFNRVEGRRIKLEKERLKGENRAVPVDYMPNGKEKVRYRVQKFMHSIRKDGAPLTEALINLANEVCQKNMSGWQIAHLYAFEMALRTGAIRGDPDVNFELIRIPTDANIIRKQDRAFFPFEGAATKILVFDWRRGIYLQKDNAYSGSNTGFRCIEEITEQ